MECACEIPFYLPFLFLDTFSVAPSMKGPRNSITLFVIKIGFVMYLSTFSTSSRTLSAVLVRSRRMNKRYTNVIEIKTVRIAAQTEKVRYRMSIDSISVV